MKCKRCKKDFCFWTELRNYKFVIPGYKKEPQTIEKKDLCEECAKFYYSIVNKDKNILG